MPDGDKIPPLPKGYEAITNTPPLPKGYFDVKKKDGSSDNGTDGIGGFSTQQSANGFDNLKNAIGDFHVQPQANSNASLGVDVGMKPVDTNAIKEQEQKTAKQAAINNAHDYFDNNQPLLEQLAKNNENLLEKDEEGKPIKGQYDLKKLEQTPIFNKKVNEILDASKNGNLAITKYQNGKKIGQPVFSKPAGFLESLGNSISNSFKQTKDAIVTKFKSPEEVADYFDKQRKDLPDVPESVPTGYGSMAGNAIGGIIKPAAEFSVGEGIFPGGGGLVTAAADIIPTTTSEKTKEIYYDRMNALEAKYGKDKVPENERLDAIHKALSQAPLQALPSEAMQLYLFGKGGNAANAEAIQSFGKVLKNAGADVGKMALAGGGSEIATQGIKQLQSGDGKFDDNISAAAGQWAMMEAAFKALPVTSKALGSVYSKFVNSNAKNVLATADPEVTQKLSEQAVQQGWLSQDQADEVQKDVQNFAKIKETIPTNIPENKAALVTGLIQKNESLEADKKTQNPIFHDDINAEIKANEQKAKDILNSSQPLKHEVDNLTGEKGVNTGGRPAKNQIADFADRVTKGEKMTSLEDLEFYDNNRNEIENELQAKKNQTLPASENNENGNSENGRLAPSEGSTNKKDVGETLQSQQEKVADIEKRRQEELSTVKPLNEALKVGGSFNYGDVKDAKIESIKKRGDVLSEHNSKSAMAKSLVEKYDYDLGYQKYLAQHSEVANQAKATVDAMSEEEMNHVLALDADKNNEQEMTDYIDNLHSNPKTNSVVEDKGETENISQPEQESKDEPLDDLVHHEMPPTILSHRGLQEVSTEFGLGDVEKRTRKSDVQLRKDADNTIGDWKEKGSYSSNVEGLISDAEKGEVLTDEERIILQDHLANLRQQLRDIGKSNSIHSTEFKSKWDEIYRVKQAGATTRSEAGAALRVGDNASVPDDTLEGYLAQEQDLNKGAPLTDNQITTAVNEFSKIDAANNEFQQKYEDLQAKYAKLLAERELKKTQASTAKNTKKTHEDFVKERTDIVKDIREKLKKAREETSVTVVPYAKELIAIAPDVAKLAKSLIEEGVTKLDDIVKNIHGQLKDDVPNLEEKDVHDILAGNYNEKKKTRNEITEQMQNLRIQAGLINRLEKLEDGEIPKNEKKKIERNQEIKELRDKIKTHGLTKLSEIKSRNERELEKINQQLKSGDFEPPKKKTPLSQDDELKKNFPQAYKETLASQTKVYKARQERQLRMALRQFDNLSKRQKFAKNAVRYLNVPRTLMASMDYSAPLRQGLVATVAHPFTAAKAFAIMFKHGWSQEAFDRFYHEIHESPRWQLYQDSKLALTDPHSLHLNAQEEAFLGGNVAEKIPVLGKGVKASERAYVSYLNKMRIDLFDRFADAFEEDGKTYSNSPELYKALANYINSATGRGDLGFADAAAPLLNTVLFSPRLIASRINMLTNWMNPNFYRTVPKAVRVLYFQDMAKFIGVGVSFLALAKYGFGADVELDPRSSDFGKIKVGNTRWDIWGGFQQYIRVLAQLMTGQRKSQAAGIKDIDKQFGQNRLDILYSFARGKLAPIPSMAADILGGRTSSGQKINRNFDWNSPQGEESLTDEAINHLVPLIGSDVYAAMKEQGAKAIFTVGIPSTFGVGVQTYALTPTKSKTNKTQVRQTPKRQVIQHR